MRAKALVSLAMLCGCFTISVLAQQAKLRIIHGKVINGVTYDPVPRALVFSPNDSESVMTNSDGEFEFEIRTEGLNGGITSGLLIETDPQPAYSITLSARKPRFISQADAEVEISPDTKQVVITLYPEAQIVGKIATTSDVPEKLQIELYKRTIDDGAVRWASLGTATTLWDGDFRFGGLTAGVYKIFSRDAQDSDRSLPTGQQFGFPPVFFPNASDFQSGEEIHLLAGETFHANLSAKSEPYFPVEIAVLNVPQDATIKTNVARQNAAGPGYSLGYNVEQQKIDGLLPADTFTIEAFIDPPTCLNGSITIAIRAPVPPGMAIPLEPCPSVRATVSTEFRATHALDSQREAALYPRTIELKPDDDFGQKASVFLYYDQRKSDRTLIANSVQPGRYRVLLDSLDSYVSSLSSGDVNLMQDLLTVAGTGANPIEVVLRDDFSFIGGIVEAPATDTKRTFAENLGSRAHSPIHAYCIPIDVGQFTELPVSEEGKILPTPVPPGKYLVIALNDWKHNIEFRNPAAVHYYEEGGQIVNLMPGRTEQVKLKLVSDYE